MKEEELMEEKAEESRTPFDRDKWWRRQWRGIKINLDENGVGGNRKNITWHKRNWVCQMEFGPWG